MLTTSFLFLACALASPAAASPTRRTSPAAKRSLFGGDASAGMTVAAAPCSSAAPFACDASDAFCCAESTQCLPVGGGQSWVCRVGKGIANAFSCGASDTACADGVTCCPEDMACAPGGGCVSTDMDLGGDEDDPRAQTEQCDDGETLCVNACCTEEEVCDAKTGMCMLASAEPKNATIPASAAGPALINGHEYMPPSGMFSGKDKSTMTAALNGTAAALNGTTTALNGTTASLKGAAETGLNRTSSAALNGTSSALNKTSSALNGTSSATSSARNRTSAVANGTASEEGTAAVNAAVAHVQWGVPIVTVGVSLSVVALSVLCMDR